MTKRSSTIQGPFVPHRLALMESHAWKARTVPLMRVLERLETEHMRHAGSSNGQLYVSYGQFQQAGISRKTINAALKLGVDLGLLKIRSGSWTSRVSQAGVLRPPQAYRLTYLPTSSAAPTDEWKHVTSSNAQAALAQYRKATAKKNKAPVP